MARLLVSAVSRESAGSDTVHHLLIYVSVSRAEDGSPVTGLDKTNFQITSNISIVVDPTVAAVHETKWEPGDAELSGCYAVNILRAEGWGKGQTYAFGVQARTFNKGGPRAGVADQGQTAVSVVSTGV